MGLAANRDLSRQIGIGQWLNRAEDAIPAVLPLRQEGLACGRRIDELSVPIARRLLAVGRQKIDPPRAHVAHHVLHNDRDRIGLVIERLEELLVRDLLHRPFPQLLVVAEDRNRILDVRRSELKRHAQSVVEGRANGPCLPDWGRATLAAAVRSKALHASLSMRIRNREDARCPTAAGYSLSPSSSPSLRSSNSRADSPHTFTCNTTP